MSLTENHTIAELLYENGKLSAELEAERFMLELITSLSSTELIDDGDKVAHDDAVGGVVQLLQQVAEDQRQGEQQQALDDAALGHQIVLGGGFNGVCHGRSPFDAVDENYLLP